MFWRGGKSSIYISIEKTEAPKQCLTSRESKEMFLKWRAEGETQREWSKGFWPLPCAASRQRPTLLLSTSAPQQIGVPAIDSAWVHLHARLPDERRKNETWESIIACTQSIRQVVSLMYLILPPMFAYLFRSFCYNESENGNAGQGLIHVKSRHIHKPYDPPSLPYNQSYLRLSVTCGLKLSFPNEAYVRWKGKLEQTKKYSPAKCPFWISQMLNQQHKYYTYLNDFT